MSNLPKKVETYEMEPHNFKDGVKVGGKVFCLHCGLIALNNPFTRWAIDKGCLANLHPDYQRMRKLTNRF
jgi:hypothetical protein